MPIDRSRSEKFISRALVKRKTVESLARKYSQLSREAWSLILPHFAYLPVGKTCLMWAPRYNCVWSAALFFFFFLFFPLLCVSFFLSHTAALCWCIELVSTFPCQFLLQRCRALVSLCWSWKFASRENSGNENTLKLETLYFTSPARTPVYLLIL